MLQRIRDSLQAQRWLALVILGALALVFAAWGAYGIVDLSIGAGNYAAKVEGEKVTLQEAQEAWQRQQMQWSQNFGGALPDELRARLQEQVLESLVVDALVNKHTEDMGYRVSDAQIVEEIRRIPQFQVDGKYSPEAARFALQQAGLSLPEFEASIRRGMRRAQLETAIRASDFVTPTELARLQALQTEQREVRYVVVPSEKFAKEAKIDDAAIEKHYKDNQARFMTPEYVDLAYGELRLEQVASQVTVSDDELKAAYEKDKQSYVQPEKRRARHILIEAGKDDAAAQKKAQELLAEAKAGKDFAELAKANSQDPGSASKGGDLGWAERGYFDPAFADALFSMSVGEIRGPVKSQFGYHIIKLEEIQPGKTRTFEEVRPEIEAQLRRQKAGDRFGDLQEALQRKLEEQPGIALADLAKEFNLQAGDVPQFQRGTGGAPLGNSPELEEVVFSPTVLDEKRVGGPVALGEDRIVVVSATNHHKPEPKPLASVREEIVTALRKEHGTQAAAKAADEARARLDIGTPFEQVAKELGVTPNPATFIGRDDPSVPAQIRDAVFRTPRPTGDKSVNRTVAVPEGTAVFAVTGVRTEPSPDPNLQARLKEEVAARQGMADAAAYVDELRRTADVSKNPKAFE
ncbi:MAG: peptidyl-prolyl cis-trans isomerase [Steroidobacteraceae bacterium]|nr:peptidyl-prolyl cis-trans isomerase [Steroidobacteraceae bacterium]